MADIRIVQLPATRTFDAAKYLPIDGPSVPDPDDTMDCTVAKKDFQKLLTRAQAVADKRSTQPMLQTVLLEADGGRVSARATDLVLSVEGYVTGEIKKPGSVAVPARELLERVKNLPDGPLQMTADASNTLLIRVVGAARWFKLPGVPGRDFPTFPTPRADAPRLSLDAEVVALLLARTKFSISPDDTRPNLNSALFEWNEGLVRVVTTDGHRLSKMEIKVEGGGPKTTFLLPSKAVVELEKLAGEVGPGKLTLVPSEPNAFFQVDDGTLGVKLIDATFPSYEKVIPASSSKVARIPRAHLDGALNAVSLAASDKTGGVKLALSKGTLRISGESAEAGEAQDEVPMDYAGDDITIGFNARYFRDVLQAMPAVDEIQLGLSGELDPAVIRPVGDAAERDYLAVVMPMRI